MRTKQHKVDSNHISINFIYSLLARYSDVLEAISGSIERHAKRLWRLHITGSEIQTVLEDNQEIQTDRGTMILKSIGEKAPPHLQPIRQPYFAKESPHPKRYQAHLARTAYVYDFPEFFSETLQNVWLGLSTRCSAHRRNPSRRGNPCWTRTANQPMSTGLHAITRSFGMVGWVLDAKTPEYPNVRNVVVIANGTNCEDSSFGPTEDNLPPRYPVRS